MNKFFSKIAVLVLLLVALGNVMACDSPDDQTTNNYYTEEKPCCDNQMPPTSGVLELALADDSPDGVVYPGLNVNLMSIDTKTESTCQVFETSVLFMGPPNSIYEVWLVDQEGNQLTEVGYPLSGEEIVFTENFTLAGKNRIYLNGWVAGGDIPGDEWFAPPFAPAIMSIDSNCKVQGTALVGNEITPEFAGVEKLVLGLNQNSPKGDQITGTQVELMKFNLATTGSWANMYGAVFSYNPGFNGNVVNCELYNEQEEQINPLPVNSYYDSQLDKNLINLQGLYWDNVWAIIDPSTIVLSLRCDVSIYEDKQPMQLNLDWIPYSNGDIQIYIQSMWATPWIEGNELTLNNP